MLIPNRCFSCGKVIGHLWEEYLEILSKNESDEYLVIKPENSLSEVDLNKKTIGEKAFEILDIEKVCCRRHFPGTVDLFDLV